MNWIGQGHHSAILVLSCHTREELRERERYEVKMGWRGCGVGEKGEVEGESGGSGRDKTEKKEGAKVKGVKLVGEIDLKTKGGWKGRR